MDALKIALETIFVGVLALPWMALAAQLFFSQFSLPKTKEVESWLARVWSTKSEVIGYAVVGVLSVAMAYTLGAAVSRLAQDSFNDDDLLPLDHDLLPYVPTEDRIRASVYCDPFESELVEIRVPFRDSSGTFLEVNPQWFRELCARDKRSASNRAWQIFSLQETALLLAGEDKVSRLRLLHQQIMVLRGAAFDGLITCVLCLLGWNAKQQSWGPWRWVLPIGLLFWFSYAFWNHFQLFQNHQLFRYEPDDPPFTELTLLLMGVGGCYVTWKGAKGSWPRGTGWVSLLFAALAYSGWYWTEILYDRMIIYSAYASQHHLLK
jgi:hypothetical protein